MCHVLYGVIDKLVEEIQRSVQEVNGSKNLDLALEKNRVVLILVDKLHQVIQNQKDELSNKSPRVQAIPVNMKEIGCDQMESTSFSTFSVEEKALGNPLLVTKILRYLPPSDLKTCRLLNSTWNQFSSESLTKQNSLQLTLEFDPKYTSYFIRLKNKPIPQTLEIFNNLLEKSSFPCTHLCIEGQLFLDPHLSTFLESWKYQLKSFQWNNNKKEPWENEPRTTSQELNAFRDILGIDGLHIEALHLKDISFLDPLYKSGTFKSLDLSSLKTFTLDIYPYGGMGLAGEIMAATQKPYSKCAFLTKKC